MFHIDNDSAALAMPVPTSAGTPGYFTDGNPATGLAATVMPSEFMNMIMMELANLVTSAGLTLSKSDYTQVTQAVTALIADLGTVTWANVTNKPTNLVQASTTPNLTSLELYSDAPYIDFHEASGTTDYNIRLVNDADSQLSIKNSSGALFTLNGTGLTLPGALTVTGAAALGSLSVTAAATLSSTLAVTGKTTLAGALAANGGASVVGTLSASGAATLSSTLAVTGGASLASTLTVAGTSTFTGLLTATGGISAGSAGITTTGSIIGTAIIQAKGASAGASAIYQMADNTGTELGAMYGDSTGAIGFRSKGATTANLYITTAGIGTFKGTVQAGNGSATLNTDGNILGSAWSTSNLVADLSTTIPARLASQTVNGSVGSYAYCKNSSGAVVASGSTVAGSSLSMSSDGGTSGTYLTGTWKCMGYGLNNYSTLWLRIA